MMTRIVFSLLACALLSGCSYGYDLLATVRHGKLTFIVDPRSRSQPSCLRQIEVTTRSDHRASTALGDDASRVAYGTFWFESVDYADDCANTFPLAYGSSLGGKPLLDRGKVTPKPLLREVEYEVTATTGATGYGSGRFVIHQDGRVDNLPPASLQPNEAGKASNAQ